MANVVCELLNLHPSAHPEGECLVQKYFFCNFKRVFLKFLFHFDNSNSNWSLSTLGKDAMF